MHFRFAWFGTLFCILGMGSASTALAKPSTHVIAFERLQEVELDSANAMDAQTRNIIASIQLFDESWDLRAFADWITPEQMARLPEGVLETLVYMNPTHYRFVFQSTKGSFQIREDDLQLVDPDKIYGSFIHGQLHTLHDRLWNLGRSERQSTTHTLGVPTRTYVAGLVASLGISVYGMAIDAAWSEASQALSQVGMIHLMFSSVFKHFGSHSKLLSDARKTLLSEVDALKRFAGARAIKIRPELLDAIDKVSPSAFAKPKHTPRVGRTQVPPRMRYRLEASKVISVLRDVDHHEIVLHLPDELILELPSTQSPDFERALGKVLSKGYWLRFPELDDHFVWYAAVAPHAEFSPNAGSVELWKTPYLQAPAKLIRVLRTMGSSRVVPFNEIEHWSTGLVECSRKLAAHSFWSF